MRRIYLEVITVKKNRLAEFFKSKGYYVLLFVGIIAIAAVALIGSNLSSTPDNEGENSVDLNEPDNSMIAEDDDNDLQVEDNTTSDMLANNEEIITDPDVIEGVHNDQLLEFDVFTEEEENGIDLAEVNETADAAVVQDIEEQPSAVETTGATVKNTTPLSFDADAGFMWPVDGNVIMNYSKDHLIYFATLMQFKVNPAIIIDAEVGTEVKAATTGIITDIFDDPVTGLTVTMDIGDGYSVLYGQLANVDHKIGDRLSEGDTIGTISEPTKYYTIEGSNLYFMVLEDEETVNPMLYLR